MSNDEKAAQIGNAVTAYQAAKVECAHVEKKIERVFDAYFEAGKTMDRDRGAVHPPEIRDGKLIFGYTARAFDQADLLDAADLRKLVEERDAARARLEQARKAMNDLGVTGLG